MTRHEAVDALVQLANTNRIPHESVEGQALTIAMKSLLAWDKLYGGLDGEKDKYKKDGYFFQAQVYEQVLQEIEIYLKKIGD